jgi:uncharacterized damage-inducible protein DinB
MTPEAFLTHWQGHRRLTRRVIEAFPEDQFFTFSVGGMRSFGTLANEMLGMAVPMVRGAVTGEWTAYTDDQATTKTEVLRRWDDSTTQLAVLWPRIPLERFAETLTAFGQYTDTLTNLLLYVVDNEIHHRAQGYVYLRALGIEPPPFYVRD